jgi:hypothetical protein
MDNYQLSLIFSKYLSDNPVVLHQSAHTSFYNSLVNACKLKISEKAVIKSLDEAATQSLDD